MEMHIKNLRERKRVKAGERGRMLMSQESNRTEMEKSETGEDGLVGRRIRIGWGEQKGQRRRKRLVR